MRRRTLKAYIEVQPQEVRWITTTTDVDYDLRSNTWWKVE